MSPDSRPSKPIGWETLFWASVARTVKPAFKAYKVAGLLEAKRNDEGKRVREWRNVPWHNLSEVPRTEVLGKLLGFSKDLVSDSNLAASVHDFDKRPEIELHKRHRATGMPYLSELIAQGKQGSQQLREMGFRDRVVWLASAPGGLPDEITKSFEIASKPRLTDDEWAFLISHYVDDMSIGAKWVLPSTINDRGLRVNVIRVRAEENKLKDYSKVSSAETQAALADHPVFGGMITFDAMALVSLLIGERLAKEIKRRTGKKIDPIMLPETVDDQVRKRITAFSEQDKWFFVLDSVQWKLARVRAFLSRTLSR